MEKDNQKTKEFQIPEARIPGQKVSEEVYNLREKNKALFHGKTIVPSETTGLSSPDRSVLRSLRR